MTSSEPQFGFAVMYVDDMEAAKRFYVDVMGLKVQRAAPTFVQFDRFALATDESMDGRRSLELYWLVPDAEAALRQLRSRTEVTMELKTLPFGRVFGIRDPMGQQRYVLELARMRPSQSVSA